VIQYLESITNGEKSEIVLSHFSLLSRIIIFKRIQLETFLRCKYSLFISYYSYSLVTIVETPLHVSALRDL